MRDCNSQLSPRADSSVISANMSSQSSSCEQVRKARRPSCSTTRSSSSAKPSSASALSSARREATSNVVTCRRRPLSAGSFSAIEFPSASSARPASALAGPAYQDWRARARCAPNAVGLSFGDQDLNPAAKFNYLKPVILNPPTAYEAYGELADPSANSRFQ